MAVTLCIQKVQISNLFRIIGDPHTTVFFGISVKYRDNGGLG